MTTKEVHCQCGEWSGAACLWHGPVSETVRVKFVPERDRDERLADMASQGGQHLDALAVILRVERSCAELMLADDPDWCEVIDDRPGTRTASDPPTCHR